jgi:methylenetetrahydrofolate dehydrogenase (NADP+) / methenyltetrahydrofolate cyclohydrolase
LHPQHAHLAHLIDGKAQAALLRGRVRDSALAFTAATGKVPGLAVVLVGDDPASRVYVANKGKATIEAGLDSIEHRLPDTTTQAELLALVANLNADPSVNGILVQLPLPAQIDAATVIAAIDPAKDVDGFHPVNAGGLATGTGGFAPCTPLGCLILAKSVHESLAGLNAVVVGRSNIVGKPVALLLLAADATVTIAHSRSRDLAAICRSADILVAAVGRPEMIRGDWIKPGATVIDVGINRVPAPELGQKPDGSGRTRLVGDVHLAEAMRVAGAVTPVPGGVGPMTIACLLANTMTAAHRQAGLTPPVW